MTTPPAPARRDLVRTTLTVLAIGAMIAGCFYILKPFVPALLWASTIVIATWPILLWLERRLWGKRALAVTAMTLLLVVVLVAPLGAALAALVAQADDAAKWASALSQQTLPPPPEWLDRLPVVGARLGELWRETAMAGAQGLFTRLVPYADDAVLWLVGKIGDVGVLIVHLFFTALLSAVLWAKGETAAAELDRIVRRLSGEQGAVALGLVARTVRGVALGVVVTALVQALMGGAGLWAAGVPSPAILTAVMLVLGVAQLGPAPVLLPATLWLYWDGRTGWAIALFAWTLVVGTLDNFLRPALVQRAEPLPFILVFVGVLGGLVAFGIVGLFVGPVVLAVAWRLLDAWAADDDGEPPKAEVAAS